jgi:hypothetical protein
MNEERATLEGRWWLRAAAWCAALVLMLGVGSFSGCAGLHSSFTRQTPHVAENPLFVPAMDREFLWNQCVDAIDDYFRIQTESRVRLDAGILTEGQIHTYPTTGSTWLEPWRTDSTRGYEKWHATFQSIRRRATLRVIPTEGGYLIDVYVLKELEDLDKPENATAGGATLRHDGSLVRQEGAAGRYSVTLGWIPVGRDMTLEQQILADLQARLNIAGELAPLPATEEVEEVKPGLRSTKVEAESLPEPLLRSPDR